MEVGKKRLLILVAEDSEDEALLLNRAFRKAGVFLPVHICLDGEDTMRYLKGEGRYADREKFPFPRVLITDIKMPLRSGFDVLEWLQKHPECNLIPKLVLSSSNDQRDVIKAYQLGANCYFTKPSTQEHLCRLIQLTSEFWTTAELPPLPTNC